MSVKSKVLDSGGILKLH